MSQKEKVLVSGLIAAREAGNDHMADAIEYKLRAMAQRNISIGVGGGAAHSHMLNMSELQKAVMPKPRSLEEKLCARMDWHTLQNAPFHIHIYASDGPVHIFIVKDGQCTVLQDDGNLFPCDELVTKLRLLGGSDG